MFLPLKTWANTCVYIASYEMDYSWQADIVTGLKSALGDRCELKIFFMDSKKFNQHDQLVEIAQRAKEFVEQNHPDVVLFSGDNAVKYVLKPFFNNPAWKTVFSGLNDTAKPYQLNYHYTTGMVEKMPSEGIFSLVRMLEADKALPRVTLITVDETSNNKDLSSFILSADNHSVELKIRYAEDLAGWKNLYRQIQDDSNTDVILLGNTQKLADWRTLEAKKWALEHLRKPTIAYLSNMKPLSLFTVEKSAKEHGRWLGDTALQLLSGTEVSAIPVVPSHEVLYWLNEEFELSLPKKLSLPQYLLQNLNVYRKEEL